MARREVKKPLGSGWGRFGVVVFLFDCWISQVFDEVQEVRYIAGITTRKNRKAGP